MTLDEAIIHAEEVSKDKCSKCAEEHRQLADWLKELKALREAQWVSVNDRLPKDGKETYLIYTNTGYICECRWTNVNPIWTNQTIEWHWCIFDIPHYTEVIAWMPKPPLPDNIKIDD